MLVKEINEETLKAHPATFRIANNRTVEKVQHISSIFKLTKCVKIDVSSLNQIKDYLDCEIIRTYFWLGQPEIVILKK